jgi:hypothetical protein
MAMAGGKDALKVPGRAGMIGKKSVFVLLAAGLLLAGAPQAAPVKKEKPRQVKARSGKDLYTMALLSLHGTMVPRDEKLAFRLMEQAANKGHAPAVYYLGVFYHDGIGVKMDRQKAAAWLAKSADLCDPQGEFSYGLLLLAGDGVEPDREEGLELIGRAAGRGYVPAADFLKRLVSYRGPSQRELLGEPRPQPVIEEKDGRTGFERGGLVVDKGEFSLKFSLPDLSEPPYPRVIGEDRLLDRIQGGKVELIIPLGTGK